MSGPQHAPHGSLNFGAVIFSPNGRINQGQYWIGILILFFGNILVNFLGGIGILLWAALAYVGFCVYGKRLHDIGKSIWVHAIVWLVILIIAIGSLFMSWGALELIMAEIDPQQAPTEEEMVAIMTELGPELIQEVMPISLAYLINTGIWLIYTVWLGAMGSQKFDNRFGRGPTGEAL